MEAGRPKEALEHLKQAYRLKKSAATAADLGRCCYALGDVTKAKPLLEEAAASDIRNTDNSLLLGRICVDRGLGALAEKHLLAAEEAGLDSQELHLLLTRAYLLQRKFVGPVVARRISPPPEAGSMVSEGIVLGPLAAAPGCCRLATRFCALYEGYRLLKAEPGNADGLYAVAVGWWAAGDLDRAAGGLKALAAREPDSRRTLKLGAELLIAKDEFAALERHLDAEAARKAFAAEELGDFYYQSAVRLRGRGMRREALAMLAKAEGHVPSSGNVLRALGALHHAMGNREAAAGCYARMVELFPDADDIDELRNTLKVLGGTCPDEADKAPAREDAGEAPEEPPGGTTRPTTGPSVGEADVEFE